MIVEKAAAAFLAWRGAAVEGRYERSFYRQPVAGSLGHYKIIGADQQFAAAIGVEFRGRGHGADLAIFAGLVPGAQHMQVPGPRGDGREGEAQ